MVSEGHESKYEHTVAINGNQNVHGEGDTMKKRKCSRNRSPSLYIKVETSIT